MFHGFDVFLLTEIGSFAATCLLAVTEVLFVAHLRYCDAYIHCEELLNEINECSGIW